MSKDYQKFLESKIVVSKEYGATDVEYDINPMLFDHQRDIVKWSLKGGRRAIFAAFGLGKTFMQLEIAKNVIQMTNKPFLICLPLGVRGEFIRDGKKLGLECTYITSSEQITGNNIYLTNYERVRKGEFDATLFGGCSFDEASILRSLDTLTVDYVLKNFKEIEYRFVCTATPTPNDFIEILNYADYLGVIDRGQALTRFFQRDSTSAGHLTLYPHKKDEFWFWVSSWAVFITKPSDLGYDNTGYDLPKLEIVEHCITDVEREQEVDRDGNLKIFNDATSSLSASAKEKRQSMQARLNKAVEIAKNTDGNIILWHHLEKERQELESMMHGYDWVSVYGSQDNDLKEKKLINFSESKHTYLITKPTIAGSGCNFQYASHEMVFCGIDYKFNDFIQAVHRCYRFQQTKVVKVHLIYTDLEHKILKTLYRKWAQHDELQREMIQIVKDYGLNKENIQIEMKRNIGVERKEYNGKDYQVINNDCVLELEGMQDNSIDLTVTSIPFGDHYEYSPSYNDFGHNYGNNKFFEQMDYMTPELFRATKAGRIAAIHVKDRIRYSYQNGAGFTTIDDFSGETVLHFKKHGWWLIGKITITTDVVRENNQTYRLGWSEQCKDGSKMGVGLPEYVLLFRKPPSDLSNGYADEPVFKSKEEYTRANWQLDAHAYWRSSGDRFLTPDEYKKMEIKHIRRAWNKYHKENIYSFKEHLAACENLEGLGRLSSTFMTLPTESNNDAVWTDVNRMNTLNSKQAQKKLQKHICPLQFDIVERLIERYSAKGELVFDPFGGLCTVPYQAIKMGRKAKSTELNTDYFMDGLHYMKALEYQLNMPTLFDFEECK